MRFGRDDTRPELQIPEHIEMPSRIVVIETDQANERRTIGIVRIDTIDEPLAMSCVDDLPLLGQTIRGGDVRRTDARSSRIEARRFEDQRLEFAAGPCARIKSVSAAHCTEFVSAQLSKDDGESTRELGGELAYESLFATGDFVDLAAEETTEIEQTRTGQGAENGFDAWDRDIT